MLYGPANNPLLPIDAAGMNLMQEPYSTDASELLGEAESSTAGVLPLASTRASPDFLAPLRAYIASDAFIDGICTEGFRHPKMISNLSGSGPGTLMYDRFINACRTRIAEHSKAAAAQGKDAHTSSPRDSKPPCVLIVFHGTADENIEAAARRKDALNIKVVEQNIEEAFGKKVMAKVIGELGSKKEQSGITGLGVIYERIFPGDKVQKPLKLRSAPSR